MRSTFAISMFLAVMSTATVHGDVLVDWDFSVLGAPGSDNTAVGGDANTGDNQPVTNLLGAVNANAISGITVTGITDGGSGVLYSNGTPSAGEANVKQWDTPQSVGDGVNDNFLQFTITADTPGTLNIDSISISQWRNGAGAPDGIAFDVSVDGGPFSLYDAVQVDPNFGDGIFDTFTFVEAIAGADMVDIRLTPRQVNQGSTGNLHINGLTVNGSVAVPEPASVAIWSLLALCGIGYALARRRHSAC